MYMRRFNLFIGSAAALLLSPLAMVSAQTIDASGVGAGFLTSILAFIDNILIPFIIGIGFLVFVWGMFRYFIAGGANDEAKEQGKSLMIYATLGFILIVVFWGVVNLLATGTGLDGGAPIVAPKVTR